MINIIVQKVCVLFCFLRKHSFVHYTNISEDLLYARHYARCKIFALGGMLSPTEIRNNGGGANLRENV